MFVLLWTLLVRLIKIHVQELESFHKITFLCLVLRVSVV